MKQPTEPYKGVRDFYPEDYFIREYIEDIMAQTCEEFGFERYDASILEPADLYRGKTSDEIVNEQTYTFTDRGDREVTLRPEMTPTVARMVASRRKELPYPLRWYSIPNVFRYERPQRGRLREHWQLNADMFGVAGIEAEAEIIALAYRIMTNFGAHDTDFSIRINDRMLFDDIFTELSLNPEERTHTMRLLDKRAKIENFAETLGEVLGTERARTLVRTLDATVTTPRLTQLLSLLSVSGIHNAVVDTSIARGFDYYTGVVFEVFDTSPANNRSLFGGGRYDNLLNLFGVDPVPTVGFGMGDVTMRDFLETHNLLPAYRPAAEVMLCVLDDTSVAHALSLARTLRGDNVAVAINYPGRKLGDQIKAADKLHIPYVIPIGQNEAQSGMYTVRHLPTGTEHAHKAEHIAEHLLTALG
jgi:histidyl-tRNA synthetase